MLLIIFFGTLGCYLCLVLNFLHLSSFIFISSFLVSFVFFSVIGSYHLPTHLSLLFIPTVNVLLPVTLPSVYFFQIDYKWFSPTCIIISFILFFLLPGTPYFSHCSGVRVSPSSILLFFFFPKTHKLFV